MQWFLEFLQNAFGASVLTAIGLWVARDWITPRLTKSIQHEFDTKMESLRAEFRKSEELFRADLHAKEAEISALRGGALATMASRQAEVDKRRLEAIGQLWNAFVDLRPAKHIMVMLSSLNFDEVLARIPRDEHLQRVFREIGKDFDETKIDFGAPEKTRPFISAMAWALFSAYQAIVMNSVTKLRLVQMGFGDKDLLDTKLTKKIIVAALPYMESYLEEHGDKVHHLLIETIEANLLTEIQKMMAGEEEDRGAVKRAEKILDATRPPNHGVDLTMAGGAPSNQE